MIGFHDLDLFDELRGRALPVRLWVPELPIRAWLIFSSGFGGDRSGYAYLGRSWAKSGLATAVVEHVGSNSKVLKSLSGKTIAERNRQVMRKVAEPAELEARPRDLVAVYNKLCHRFIGMPLGLAGHSFGSYTVLSALGMRALPKLEVLEQPLSVATSCLVMSPQPAGFLFSPGAFQAIECPILVATGTKDAMLDGSGDYRMRMKVYDYLPPPRRNLAVFEDVEHLTFAGIGVGLNTALSAIGAVTTKWWDSSLWGAQKALERAKELEMTASAVGAKGVYK